MRIDDGYAPSFPTGLTRMASKALLYSLDPYFWEGWEDIRSVAGARSHEIVFSHSLVLLRPDSIAGRKVEAILDWLPRNGFALVDYVPIRVDRHQVRALWQYQWNNARRERKDACDALMSGGPSLLLIVASEARDSANATDSTAERFAASKGSADPAQRRPCDLRTMLGHKSRMLSFIHSPDEPADFVREIAIFLDEDARGALCEKMLHPGKIGLDRLADTVASMYTEVPENSLDLSLALDRIERCASRFADESDPMRSTLFSLLGRARSGDRLDWRDLFSVLDRHAVAYDPWDRIVVAGHVIAMDLPGKQNLLGHPPGRGANHLDSR